jgi:hypothetical protein
MAFNHKKLIMKKIIFQLAAILLFILAACMAEAQGARPSRAANIIATLDSSYVYYSRNPAKHQQLVSRFDSLFNLLVQDQKLSPTAISNEETLENKLIAMAKFQAQQPARFSEVQSRYLFSVEDSTRQAPASPRLLPVHVTEEYRLAWEFVLLHPPALRFSPRYDQRAADALRLINNPASVTTFEFLYKFAASRNVKLSYPLVDKQRLAVTAISRMPSDKALTALVRVIQHPLPKTDSAAKELQWSPGEYARRIIHLQPELSNRWKNVANRVNATRFNAAGKAILRNLNLD